MGLTNFPGGVTSMGSVLPAGGGVSIPSPRTGRGGRHYWVDGDYGNDGAGDCSEDQPWKTMDRVFDDLIANTALPKSRSVIHVWGNIAEQLTAPAGVFDVTIIGESPATRHPDAHTNGGGRSAAIWKAPSSPVAATPLLILQQQGWQIINMLFAAPSDAPAVRLTRNASSGDDERDASHAKFIGCRFASGAGGIDDTGGCFNVKVQGCVFQALTSYCIQGVGNIGVGQLMWHILGNHFNNFTNGVKIAAHECVVTGNFFTDGGTPNTTFVLNMSNGAGRDNFIVENWFQGTTANFNTPDVVGNATDVWYNHALDTQAAGVNGVYEVGNPA